MSAAKNPHPNHRSRFSMLSVMTLALWRLRQTWFLLCIITIGMIAAVMIVCAIPLFSNVTMTAGLRNTLRESPDSAQFEVDSETLGLSTPIFQNARSQFNALLQQGLGKQVYPSQFLLESLDLSLYPQPRSPTSLIIYGARMQQAAPYLGPIQGRIAHVTEQPATDIEIMLTPQTVKLMHVKLGSTFKLALSFFPKLQDVNNNTGAIPSTMTLTAHVVGIFNVEPKNAAYWHGQDFRPTTLIQNKITSYTFVMLAPYNALLAISDHASALHHSDATYTTGFGYLTRWYYRLDVPHTNMDNLDTLINQIAALQSTFNTSYGDLTGDSNDFSSPPDFPYFNKVSFSSPLLSAPGSDSNLEEFRSRADVALIPITVLTILIIALSLFFVSLMTNLLVDRQAATIALLRSRGASSGQIFGALLTQSLGIGITSIVIGLPLAVIVVIALAQRMLPAGERDALNIITTNPLRSIEGVAWYAGAVVLVALLTMSVSLFFASRSDVLAMRREATRTNRRPLWQRMQLDVIAGVVALVGYGISLYLTRLGPVLQGDAQVLIVTPLSIIAPFFLIIGCMLLFLRIFPLILRLGAHFASRGRGAVSMLALAQVARSPRQSIRMTMLLALSTAFILFTLVYTASQAQHIQQIATYLVGADFGGDLNNTGTGSLVLPARISERYLAIPGVLSASAGYVGQGEGGTANLQMQIRAVDAATFAQTTIWSSPQDYQTGRALLAKLAALRPGAIKIAQQKDVQNGIVPAIIDTITLQTLRLHAGSFFTVRVDEQSIREMNCYVIGVVQHIPTINNRTVPQGSQSFATVGGVLVDYQTYATIYATAFKRSKAVFGPLDTPPINHIWLHTRSDAASLTSVRTALTKPALLVTNLSDRRVLLGELNNDPLYLVLGGVLGIGTVTALLLALLGDLLASWLSARTRLTNFAILRAIGTTPQQVASVLIREPGIIYATGLLLGVAFGALLSVTVIPALTFTHLTTNLSTNQFYALQSAFPAQVVLPPSLPLALIALSAVYILALMMMVRVIAQPSTSQVLRLNED